MSEIGITSANDKRERMVVDEVNVNSQMLLFNVADMLECRQNAIKEVNALYGTNIKVDLSDQLQGVKIDEMSMEDALKSAGITYLGVDALYEDRATGKLKDLSKIKLSDLKGTGISSAELQELARHQYNLENETQLDSVAWNDKTNKTFGMKIMDSAIGREIRGITTAQNLGIDSTADVTLLDRFMSGKATNKTMLLNLAGKITGNEKWKNATVNDTLAKYAEWRNNRYNKKMTKLEEEIAEKEAKGKDTTKLHKKLDKLKGKLGLSDSEYEELKASKINGTLPGDAGMGDGEEFDPEEQRIVEVFNEDGTLSHCITVPVKETTEVEGFNSTEILKPVAEYKSSKMQGIPQYDEKGNLISYTSVDKRKAKTGGLFSKIATAVGGFFGIGNGTTSGSVSTDNSVDNSSSVTNNTGDTYNTTNEIDTTMFGTLATAIDKLVGSQTTDNVDENGKVNTGGVLAAIMDPMGYLGKKLIGYGVNLYETKTGNDINDTDLNNTISILNILRNPFGYLYKITKDKLDTDDNHPDNPNIIQKLFGKCKRCGQPYDKCICEGNGTHQDYTCNRCGKPLKDCICKDNRTHQDYTCNRCGKPLKDCICKDNGNGTHQDYTCNRCGKPLKDCICNDKNNLFKWGKDKFNIGKEWAEGKLNQGKEWFDKEKQRSYETAAIMAGDKNAKANILSTGISNTGKLSAGIYNLFAGEGNEITSGEMTDAIATFINKAIVTPFKELANPAADKFNEVKESISDWVTEKKENIANWYTEEFKPGLEKSKESAKKTQQAIIDDVNATKERISNWYTENIGKPLEKSKASAKKTQQAIFDDVKARKDAVMDWYTENIGKPLEKSTASAKKTQQAIFDDVKARKDAIMDWVTKEFKKKVDNIKKTGEAISDWVSGFKDKIVETFNKYLKDPVSDALSPVTSAISGAWSSFKSAFEPFAKVFDAIKGGGSITDIIKNYGQEGRENAGLSGIEGSGSIRDIRPKKYRATESDFITPTNNTTNNTTNSSTNNKFVFYNQSDSRWAQNKLGNKKMKDSGCGPTSLAMAVSQLTGEQITPDTIARLGKEHLPGYSKYSLFPSVANKLNMNYTEGYDGNFIVSNLQQGKPVILSGKTSADGTPYTSEGHVVTATKMEGGKIFINDPRGKEYSGLYPINSVLTGMTKGMVVTPSNMTDVSKLSSGKLENGWTGEEYAKEYKTDLGAYGEPGEYSQLDEMSGKTGAGQITIADRVLSYARAFLNNKDKFSYSQPRRLQIDTNKSSSKGCGADCSSFVSHVLSRAGDVNIYGTTSQTFWDSVGTKVSEPQIGDVVCQQGHVGLYSGDGNYIHMSGRKAGIKESKAIQNGNQPHRGYKRVLKNPSQLVDPTVPNANTFLGTVVGTSSGHPVGGGTPAGPQASLDKALLIGDSLTEGMKPTLEGKYPNAKAMGKGGKWATQWLKSLDELPDASSVSTVIQWLGINGVHNNKVNLRDSQELLNKLKEKYPNVPIFNMDILPTTEAYTYNGYKGDWWRGLSQEFNKEMGTWTSANGVNQLNATNGFVQEDGYLDPSKAVDGIHLTTDGYKGILSNIESNLNTYNSNRNQNSSSTGGGAASAPDMLGVFGKLGAIGTGMVASIYNGKDVLNDFLYGSTTTPTDGTTPNNGTNPDIGDISDTAQAVWTFFTGKGYTPETTAGILGNMEAESGVDPTRIQNKGKGPAAGICQWESWRNKSMRWKGMADYAASKGKDWQDLQSQLEWLDMELQGKDPSTLSYLKKRVGGFEAFKSLTDVDKATTEFMKCFERPGVEHLERRLKSANDFYNRLKGGGNVAANGDITSAGTGFQMATTADPTGDSESQPEMMNGWAYYRQGDPQWQEQIGNKRIGPSGCGMASHAMMLTSMFGKKVTPVTVGKWAKANGFWENGMSWEMPPALANKLGLTMVDKETNFNGLPDSSLDKVKQHLKSGYPVILSGLSNNSKDYETPFTSGGHIVFAVGVDGSGQVIINDPRGPHRTKAYSDHGILSKGIGLRGYWAYDKPESAKLPEDWISGDFTGVPGTGTNPNNGTTPTDGTTPAAPSTDMLGVFGQLGNIATTYISSIFNGKDMFSAQAQPTTPSDGTTPNTDVTWDGTKYDTSSYDISDLSAEKQGHINAILQPALHTYKTHGLFPSVTIGQSAHESYWGPKSGLATKGKNLFGIKCGSKWTGKVYSAKTGEFLNGKNVTITDNFRAYDSWADSVLDRAKFLSADRYVKAGVLSASTPDAQIDALKKAGYATDPNYIAKLKKMVHDNKLTRFDTPKPPVEVSGGAADTSTDTNTDNAGMGDGKTYWAKGFGDNKPEKVSYSKGDAGKGDGTTSAELVNARRNMERSIREIDRNMNVINNTTNINNSSVSDGCVKILKAMLQELQSINLNTAETANNINNIEIVSPNTPVGNVNINNRPKNDIMHSNPNTGYDIARKIASYK